MLTYMLYIVLFLHQTTTDSRYNCNRYRCISYYSYIKPQHIIRSLYHRCVVYRTIPTSNHNRRMTGMQCVIVVYRTIPTSNHNMFDYNRYYASVVYRTIPTSNHNEFVIYEVSNKVVYRTIPTSNHNL